jgi:4-amino-4-deoxy-L-arabinose transferase-like glycosyltransferase
MCHKKTTQYLYLNNFQYLSQWFSKTAYFWSTLLTILFLIVGVLTLKDYGLTWDEGLGNMFFGERYLNYWMTLNPEYLDFNVDLDLHRQHQLNLYLSPLHNNPYEFPGLSDTLSAGTMYLFSYWLGWLSPIDGFHLFPILLATLFLWILFRFVAPQMGKFTALMAMLFLATFPRFWADMHFNVKDVPETIFFGLTIMSYFIWSKKPLLKKALVTGLLFGCALGTKANAFFIPFLILLAILPWNLNKQSWLVALNHFKDYFLHYIVMGTTSITFYIVSWPYLHNNVIANIRPYISSLIRHGTKNDFSLNIEPIIQTITTMPEVMVIFFLMGLALLVYKAVKTESIFMRILLAWAVIPILRVVLPGAKNFDGIRHFLEFVPAAAIIAAYGASQLANIVSKLRNLPKLLIQSVFIFLVIINTFQYTLLYYPYLHIYYNQFEGGLKGARDGFLQEEATDYWGSSYRQGMEWINQNAPQDSIVSALMADWIVNISGPIFLRKDLITMPASNLPDFSVMKQAKAPTYLMFVTRPGFYTDEIEYSINRGTLVHEIVVDDVTILKIYRFGKEK